MNFSPLPPPPSVCLAGRCRLQPPPPAANGRQCAGSGDGGGEFLAGLTTMGREIGVAFPPAAAESGARPGSGGQTLLPGRMSVV